MIAEIWQNLLTWSSLDTLMVLTGALAAMSCAVPGCFLVLRRQAFLGDAISHAVLPGIVVGYLASVWLAGTLGWDAASTALWRPAILVAGAAASGMLAGFLSEVLTSRCQLDGDAALGVVFTTFFAVGLVLIRLTADNLHLDPSCVLYGNLESQALYPSAWIGLPRAAVASGTALAVNVFLVIVFYKELLLATFDAPQASLQGIPVQRLHQGLVAMTAVTVVAAFESVGSILVVTMLIAPAATAGLLTNRLSRMLAIAVGIAGVTALIGHAAAISLPSVVTRLVGLPAVSDVSSSGSMAVAAGSLFLFALVLSPQEGLLINLARQARLSLRIAREDVLAALFRLEEIGLLERTRLVPRVVATTESLNPWLVRLAVGQLQFRKQIVRHASGWKLTPAGEQLGRSLVRSHRLWETYLAQYIQFSPPSLHLAAEKAEHFIDPALQAKLAEELRQPELDPHGKQIPAVLPSDPTNP